MPSLSKELYRFALLYALLFLLTVPWPHRALPCTCEWLRPLTTAAAGWTGKNVFHLRPGFTAALHSDSAGLYVHLFNLLAVCLPLQLLLQTAALRRFRPGPPVAAVLRYFLAYQLSLYGWDKAFKWQFFLPEPNTLYTPLGQLSPDLLYWSTLGVSRPYVVALGCLELLAALLLVIRPAARTGALLAAVIFAQVLLVNCCFDISVKVFSAYLLSLSLLLTVRVTHRPKAIIRAARIYVETGLALVLAADSLWPYVHSGNFNDDAAPQPHLHGTYEVDCFIRNADTLPPLTTDTFRWRRAFVHRRGYFIVQLMNDEMRDFELEDEAEAATLWLSAPGDSLASGWEYKSQAGRLQMQGWIGADSVSLFLHRVGDTALPLLKPSFHWTTEP